jgi:hypothetical protein
MKIVGFKVNGGPSRISGISHLVPGFNPDGARQEVSFPKIPSGLDSHCKVESSHH